MTAQASGLCNPDHTSLPASTNEWKIPCMHMRRHACPVARRPRCHHRGIDCRPDRRRRQHCLCRCHAGCRRVLSGFGYRGRGFPRRGHPRAPYGSPIQAARHRGLCRPVLWADRRHPACRRHDRPLRASVAHRAGHCPEAHRSARASITAMSAAPGGRRAPICRTAPGPGRPLALAHADLRPASMTVRWPSVALGVHLGTRHPAPNPAPAAHVSILEWAAGWRARMRTFQTDPEPRGVGGIIPSTPRSAPRAPQRLRHGVERASATGPPRSSAPVRRRSSPLSRRC